MLPILHLGLGEIGKRTIAALLAQPEFYRLAAVVDVNPGLAGKRLRAVMPGKNVPDLVIQPDIRSALRQARQKPMVASLTTASQTVQVQATVEALIDAGMHVVSTCEELAFPDLRAARIAKRLDARARKSRVAILATGVNPGFAMDAFALACTAPCSRVHGIRIVRSLDAAKRRLQLQKKVGAGMEVKDVQRLIKQNAIGHVGLGESIAMIARGLGWKTDSISEKFTPVVAEKAVGSEFIGIKAGQVRGLRMRAHAIVAGKKKIELDLLMAFGAETFDEIQIDGEPSLTVRTATGFPGEAATVSLLVNALRVAPTLEPGMRTMLDVLKLRSVGD